MKKKNYTAEYKARLVLELLSGEEELGKIAQREEIYPNQLRNWKKQFLEKAPLVFEESKQEKEVAQRQKEATDREAAMLETIGQLTLERDFLMKQAHARNKGVLFR